MLLNTYGLLLMDQEKDMILYVLVVVLPCDVVVHNQVRAYVEIHDALVCLKKEREPQAVNLNGCLENKETYHHEVYCLPEILQFPYFPFLHGKESYFPF